jgi:hypothetical protein
VTEQNHSQDEPVRILASTAMATRLRRRSFLGGALAVAATGLVAACGDDSSGGSGTGAAPDASVGTGALEGS